MLTNILATLNTILISINGPTSSGKTKLSLQLARSLPDCWVINCDSRQVYKRLHIGVGKEPGRWKPHKRFHEAYYIEDIPHLLIDYIDPSKRFPAVDYIRDFINLFNQTAPQYCIVVGGSSLYHYLITNSLPVYKTKSRHKKDYKQYKTHLEKVTTVSLQEKIKEAGINLNQSDFNNPRRLVNKLADRYARDHDWVEKYDIPRFRKTIKVHPYTTKESLFEKIKIRLHKRYLQGLVAETISIQDLGTPRILELGLEYRLTQLFLYGQVEEKRYYELLLQENIKLAKKQSTWLTKISSKPIHNYKEVLKLIV